MAATEQGMTDDAPPDYWPDVRRIPDEQVRSFPESVRETRDKLGISNADIGREVQRLIDAHNNVPGRKKVISHAAWDGLNDAERCAQQLKSIRNGTRKYLVGYLAWLCLREKEAAKDLYKKLKLDFRPNLMSVEELSRPAPKKVATEQEKFYVFEAAFLWLDQAAPAMADHQSAMTPEVAKMKALLHTAVQLELLKADHVTLPSVGHAWTITRGELRRFAEASGSNPQFLYPSEEPSPEDAARSLAKAEGYLAREIQRHLIPVEDWAAEYERNEWMVYEAAFLWHGLLPPEGSKNHYVMPDTVRQTKQMLHDAANAGVLTPSIDVGHRQRNVLVHGTRFVTRPELRQFAVSIGQRPRFLFRKTEG